jgi:hypothetical protein
MSMVRFHYDDNVPPETRAVVEGWADAVQKGFHLLGKDTKWVRVAVEDAGNGRQKIVLRIPSTSPYQQEGVVPLIAQDSLARVESKCEEVWARVIHTQPG